MLRIATDTNLPGYQTRGGRKAALQHLENISTEGAPTLTVLDILLKSEKRLDLEAVEMLLELKSRAGKPYRKTLGEERTEKREKAILGGASKTDRLPQKETLKLLLEDFIDEADGEEFLVTKCARYLSPQKVRLLVDTCLDLFPNNPDRVYCLLSEAAKHGNEEIVRYMVESHQTPANWQNAVLEKSIGAKNPTIAALAIRHGADINPHEEDLCDLVRDNRELIAALIDRIAPPATAEKVLAVPARDISFRFRALNFKESPAPAPATPTPAPG